MDRYGTVLHIAAVNGIKTLIRAVMGLAVTICFCQPLQKAAAV